jgi:hypothetical protein
MIWHPGGFFWKEAIMTDHLVVYSSGSLDKDLLSSGNGLGHSFA